MTSRIKRLQTYGNNSVFGNHSIHDLVTISISPAPYILAYSFMSGSLGTNYTTTLGYLTYDIGITGPASTWIPINFSGQYWFQGQDLAASTIEGAYTSTSVSFRVDSTSFDYQCSSHVCTNSTNYPVGSRSNVWVSESLVSYQAFAGSFNGVKDVLTDASGNAKITVNMMASASSFDYMSLVSVAAMAFIDPKFFIDPAWLILNPNTALSFPLGVGNDLVSTAVPEPTFVWLFGPAFLVFTLVNHRKGASTAV